MLVYLFAGVAYLLVAAQAADSKTVRVRHASGVVMMIGGTSNADAIVAPPVPAALAQSGALLDDTSRLSVVMQPGVPLSAAAAIPPSSTSVTSRVMALSPMIAEAARAANLDSALLMAVIDVESGGNPQAVSPKGATGLMQLMPGTGARHGASDLFDPRQNIAAGARYLKQLMRQFGDLQLALAAYNAGEGAVQKYGGQIPPYAETMSYVPKVIAQYKRYQDATSSTGIISAQDVSDSVRGRFLLVRSGADD
ncbi:lytic transglycosylase domain-containing protein [Paraburkholderia fungorum]|uniref:lytic transglycosylase domain-containing protein n=1 Tax=Paraburkholderia fungorum TaxID=134537 RepID=UPI0038B8AE14